MHGSAERRRNARENSSPLGPGRRSAGFTRALALEVAGRGITVNAICPGWVETDMADLGMRETAAILGIAKDEFRRQALDAVPLKRILDPREIADLAVYLASDAASGVIGQAIVLDGGQVMP